MEASQSFQDICFRSRQTVLKMLDQRGYNTTMYHNFGPDEIAKLMTNEDALLMKMPHKTNPDKDVIVIYYFTRINIPKLGQKLFDPEDKFNVDPSKTEVIILTMEEVKDPFHAFALESWTTHKLKLQFWEMRRIVNYPLDHVLQPKFDIVPQEEHASLLKTFYTRSKTQFPMIRFHADSAGRCLGLVPGDIVNITSASPSAGEYIKYRVCVP